MDSVRRLRKERGWTQRDLAAKAGTTQYTISEIELGHRDPHPTTLRKLAQALDISVAEFFVEESPADPKAVAPLPPPQAATGSQALEGGEGRYVSVIAALRSYFWDLRLRWKEPGNKPTPAQIRDALRLLGYLTEHGTFEGPLTPREQSEVSLLFNVADNLRPLVEEFADQDEAKWLMDMCEEVFGRTEKLSR
jgi:transcriptional regulator with XRE-family HTH domain